MFARVPHAMAQYVLKIQKLYHIIGIAPILKMARAYGLHPRLWLLIGRNSFETLCAVFPVHFLVRLNSEIAHFNMETNISFHFESVFFFLIGDA